MQELPLWLVSPHSGGQIAYDRLITLLSVQTSLIKSHQTNADENIKCPETFGFSHNIFHPSLAWHKHSPDTEISPICGHDLEVRSVTVPVCTIPPRRQEGEGRGGHPARFSFDFNNQGHQEYIFNRKYYSKQDWNLLQVKLFYIDPEEMRRVAVPVDMEIDLARKSPPCPPFPPGIHRPACPVPRSFRPWSASAGGKSAV